jgi:hypothetical protein
MGGIGVGYVEKGIESIDEGPVFLILAFLAWVSYFLIIIENKWGPGWRQQRFTKLRNASTQ